MKLTNIKINFGSISLSKARNIQIIYKGFEVQIEEIAFKSNFLNSEISNPIQIFIRDVRINKNMESDDESVGREVRKINRVHEPIKQIPSILVTLVQVKRNSLCANFVQSLCLIFSFVDLTFQIYHLYSTTMMDGGCMLQPRKLTWTDVSSTGRTVCCLQSI